MRRRQWLGWVLGAAGVAGAAGNGTALAAGRPGAEPGAIPGAGQAAGSGAASEAAVAGLQWRERALLGFGTTLWLRAGHAEATRVDVALDATVALLQRLEAQLSLFRPDSALCRLNRDGRLDAPDPALVQLLQLAQQVARRSGGAFDVTLQPLWACWRDARAQGRKPTPAEIDVARARVGWQALQVSPQRVQLLQPGMALTLNGIAQGFAADAVRALLQQYGIAHALLDTGEWAPLGLSPDGSPWRLGLASPRDSARVLARLRADGRGVAVSTDAQLRFGPDPADDRDHHILDPRTGRSPTQLSAVAVAAPRTALADALTKVMFMGSAAQALATARRWGVDVIVVDKAGRMQASGGWQRG